MSDADARGYWFFNLQTIWGDHMRIFDVRRNVNDSGEYILGSEQTGSHACYLIYGTMKPGETGRKLEPGKGHEELFLAVSGDLVATGHFTGTIKEGQAVHLKGDETCQLQNDSNMEATYIISGGHSDGGHH
jgi:hypothetical protein